MYVEFDVSLSHISETLLQEHIPHIRIPGITGLLPNTWTYWTSQEMGPLPAWNARNIVYFDDRLGRYYLWVYTDYVDPQTQKKELRWYWQDCLDLASPRHPMF